MPEPTPGPGQVLVRMRYSPINPSDLLTVQGAYGRLPSLPATPGYEGMGIVEKSGGGLLGWRVLGRRVAVINAVGGNWAEKVVIPARQAVPVPDDVPDEQAAAFFVNPATVLVLAEKVLRVPPGEWLLQTAAGSALGRMMIRLGKRLGFRTLNVVRRTQTAEELRSLGADAVVDTSREDLAGRVRELTGGKGVRFAIDAVGGQTASDLVRCLAPGGRLIVYGTLAMEPMQLDQRLLIAGSKKIEGFWLSDWVRGQGPLTMLRLFRRIFQLMREKVLTTDIGAIYPLDQIAEAVRKAVEPGRSGKILLKLGSAGRQ
ncbi:MAG: zinc-dependent alcohol dehydrogenase family protein [Gemmatales bacterium]|nr:zinc-dependent alcohol dehydrogenase family protein [Gemmatales bacterium]MDW8387486.1 zinc-dependent alcohol dehydrogenase family protein [Gemmatales bacterium]